jgi:hypothetical protein
MGTPTAALVWSHGLCTAKRCRLRFCALSVLCRDTFLSLGGSVHPQEVFKRFMGREPSIDAWLRYNGLQQ